MPRQTTDDYREQIRRCARNLAVANNGAIAEFLPSVASAPLVEFFTAGNLDKRKWKLDDQFEFMADAFPTLDEWIDAYIHTVPLKAYDIGTSDSVCFLDWVRKEKSLTAEQTDFAVCHAARVRVEDIARCRRVAHVRFQEILTATPRLAGELGTNDRLWLHPNPIRVPARFHTTILLDADADVPADVLFFPVGSDVRTAVTEPSGAALIDALDRSGRCRLKQLHAAVHSKFFREEFIELCLDLAEMGLVALG